YLRAVDELLAQFDARVHWGKLHFLTRERLEALYPEAAGFIELRRALDPQGVFLNAHLRPLLA
ncbi:MAG: D-arabinono-1,4-lactone oxidase, partial [Solirubrobacteraceae bacterium]